MTTIILAQQNPGRAITVTGQAEAVILKALTFTPIDVLDFGTIVPSTSNDSVIAIAPNTGARTLVSGAASLIAGGGENDGTFHLDGFDGETVVVEMPANGSVKLQSVMEELDVHDFTWSYNGGPVITGDDTLELATGGPHIFSVGASLTVPQNMADDSYSGSYSITLNYQ